MPIFDVQYVSLIELLQFLCASACDAEFIHAGFHLQEGGSFPIPIQAA